MSESLCVSGPVKFDGREGCRHVAPTPACATTAARDGGQTGSVGPFVPHDAIFRARLGAVILYSRMPLERQQAGYASMLILTGRSPTGL